MDDGIRQHLETGVPYKDWVLNSHFQPIFSLAHRRVVGHEALLRGYDGSGAPVSPLSIFNEGHHHLDLLTVDRLTRSLHIRNFVRQTSREDRGWLFLNFNPQVIRTGHVKYFNFTRELFRFHNLAPDRVVVEILERRIQDEQLILEAVEFYRGLGCLIAVDDFGAGQSNFDRVWNLDADIVKLDRSLVVQAAINPRASPFLSSITTMLHQAGKLVLLEGIETEEHARIAMNADVDFVQGFYFARPSPFLSNRETISASIEQVSSALLCAEKDAGARQTLEMEEHVARFLAVLNNFELKSKGSQEYKAFLFVDYLRNPTVLRWFQLDENGVQVGKNINKSLLEGGMDEFFSPLGDAQGADWSRRDYFRRAMRYFGKPQVTGPYFSLPDAQTCVTLSIALRRNDGEIRVYCSDLIWDGPARPELITTTCGG
ncbi:MAG: EAL domain-containing protein [Magnetococcales bacterium]|nr:EAL domain-containing protein [Magnetococcales bacterium]